MLAFALASITCSETTEMDYFIVRVLFLAVRGELNSWREDLGRKLLALFIKIGKELSMAKSKAKTVFFAKNVVTKHPNGWDSVPVVISGIR